jgi:SAM-dependent methyltransferase
MARVSSQESPDPAASGPARTGYAQIDTTVPHPARRYNYLLGGKDNFAADRAAGDELARMFPTVRLAAVENRRFLQRVTRFLTEEAGIRQFLDIGTGLPTADNTHEVAQRIAPESRVVYVDNDPMVMAHARALLTSTPEGRTTYLEDDLRRPADILARPELHDTLDLGKPVGLMLIAVLHFIGGDGAAQPIVRTLLDALAPGSYLVLSNATADQGPAEGLAQFRQLYNAGKVDIWPRSRAEVTDLFDGLELIPPGVTIVSEWRAENDPQPRPNPDDVAVYGGIGRKP